MAKIPTAPNNLSAGPTTQSATVSVAPHTTSSIVTHSHPTSSIATHSTGSPSGPSTPVHHPRLSSTTARESTSLPMASKRRESGTRLPYPTGDYASSPGTFSPSNPLPSSISSAMRPLSSTILRLPLYASSGLGTLAGASYSTTSLSSLASLEWVRVGRSPRLLNPTLSLPLPLSIERPAQRPHQQKDEQHKDCHPRNQLRV